MSCTMNITRRVGPRGLEHPATSGKVRALGPTDSPFRSPSAASVVAGLLAAAGLLGCIEPASVSLDVIPRPGVIGAVRLDVGFSSGTESPWEESFFAESGSELFIGGAKETINIIASGRRGPITLTATALDELTTVRGIGEVETNLVDGGHREVTLMLDPLDFPISSTSNSVSFSSTANARQAASGGLNGAPQFATTWIGCDDSGCATVIRAFDGTGVPLVNSAGNDEEIPLADETNEGADYPQGVDMPAVAMRNNQTVVVTHDSGGASGSGIYSRVFSTVDTITRVPDSKTRLAAGDGATVSTPDIATLDDVDTAYVVVWAHKPAGAAGHRVSGVLLGRDGLLLAGSDAFEVTNVAAGTPLESISPAVAAGPNGDFIVGWTDNGVPKVRLFERGARPRRDPFVVAAIETNKARAIELVGLSDRYLVVWQDEVAAPESTDGDGTSIRARSLTLIGEGVEANEFTVNTLGEGDQTDPAAAARPDGVAMITWTSDSGTKGSTQDIKGRLFLSNGLPLGEELWINASEAGQQHSSSATSVGPEAFVVAFADHTELSGGDSGPVVSEHVTGRWLYPDLNRAEEDIGSRCSETNDTCEGSLQCAPVHNAGTRCVSACTGLGDYCPHGGVCTTADQRRLCLYPPSIS